jgi:hypothetical protein
MRKAAFTLILLAAVAGSSEAQVRGRGNARSQGIPPGQMPRAGECRVWHDNVPPGRQPAPTSCDQAERLASRSSNARVIYGDDRYAARSGDERYRDRTTGSSRYPGGYESYPDNRNTAYNSVPYTNGQRDGIEKGREDARDNDSYDPVRHSWYRSGDRGYNSRYGTRETYKLTYRDGFEAGYEQAYREARGYGASRGPVAGARLPRY